MHSHSPTSSPTSGECVDTTMNGASCSTVAGDCNHPVYGSEVRKNCPRMCYACPGMNSSAPTAAPTSSPTNATGTMAPIAIPTQGPTLCKDIGMSGQPCSTVADQCNSPALGAIVRKNCPETCFACPGMKSVAPSSSPTSLMTTPVSTLLPSASSTLSPSSSPSGAILSSLPYFPLPASQSLKTE